jgi:hypothetical protein
MQPINSLNLDSPIVKSLLQRKKERKNERMKGSHQLQHNFCHFSILDNICPEDGGRTFL